MSTRSVGPSTLQLPKRGDTYSNSITASRYPRPEGKSAAETVVDYSNDATGVESGANSRRDIRSLLGYTRKRSTIPTADSVVDLNESGINLVDYLDRRGSRGTDTQEGATSNGSSRLSKAGTSNLGSQNTTNTMKTIDGRDSDAPDQILVRSSTFPPSIAESRKRAEKGKRIFDLYDPGSEGDDSD